MFEETLDIDNGEILHNESSRYYKGDTISYKCNEGYRQSGERECEYDTFWNGEIKCTKGELRSGQHSVDSLLLRLQNFDIYSPKIGLSDINHHIW